MDSTQRERIIKDILNHKIELEEVGGNGTISMEKIESEREDLEELNDDRLEHWWFSNVGEWINSMRRWGNDEFRNSAGEPLWEVKGHDNPADWQYQKLLDGETPDYGYVRPLEERI